MLRNKLTHFLTTSYNYYTVQRSTKTPLRNPISQAIFIKIKSTGPITCADYMREVLRSPHGGYYMSKNMLGPQGDFITSPELSQIFGELIAIWFLNEWSKIGCPKPFQIIELGPGKGSLSEDLLRVFKHFNSTSQMSLQLVEISPKLSEIQGKKLCATLKLNNNFNTPHYQEGISREGVPVKWFKDFRDCPKMFTLFVANEFFDALPIHKFQKTENGYKEVLIDIDPKNEKKFRFVLSKHATPMTQLLKPEENRNHVEISPETLLVGEAMSYWLTENGGLALVSDYGHNGDKGDTFRAFKNHQLHDPLDDPGSADLTADLDFLRLKETIIENGNVVSFGPTNQRNFLLKMGIKHRIKILKKKADSDLIKSLDYCFEMMTDENQMGHRFKFICFLPATVSKIYQKFPVVGFS